MNWWQSILGIYYQPAKVFESMRERPRWLAALVAVVLAMAVVTAIIMKPIVLPEQLARITSNPDLAPEARDQIAERMDSPLVYWAGIANVLISQPLMLLVIALVFWGLFSALGGKTKFGAMFSVAVHAFLISIPASLVKVPLMFAKETAKVQTSLALLLSPEVEETYLFRLLAQFDFFVIWILAVMAIGCSVHAGVKRSTSYCAVFGLWLAWAFVWAALSGKLRFGMG